MSSFLVLGLIPGTPIQITFVLWLIGVIAALVSFGVWFGHRTHLFRNYVVTALLVMTVRREPNLY
ncbi:MAG TPA: hypothetical protein VJR27_01095 [Candidatus Saccharimonadales bacterium]|nr:hypothetical protein [Candidatus Saccharimonadales bacterium]